jgi:hypothetical protein
MSKFGNISVGFFTTSGDGGGGGGLTFQQCVGFGNSSTNTMEFDSINGVGFITIGYNLLRLYSLVNPLGAINYDIQIAKDNIRVLDLINEKEVLVRDVDITFLDEQDEVRIAYDDLLFQTIKFPSTNGRLEPTQTPFQSSIDIFNSNQTIQGDQSRSYYLVSSAAIINGGVIELNFSEGLTMYLFIPNTVGNGDIIFQAASGNVYGLTNAKNQCGLVTINKSNGNYWVGL